MFTPVVESGSLERPLHWRSNHIGEVKGTSGAVVTRRIRVRRVTAALVMAASFGRSHVANHFPQHAGADDRSVASELSWL